MERKPPSAAGCLLGNLISFLGIISLAILGAQIGFLVGGGGESTRIGFIVGGVFGLFMPWRRWLSRIIDLMGRKH